MNELLVEGSELLQFVKTLGDLEWAKFQARRPVIDGLGYATTEDRSSHPPYTSFRFGNENPAITQKLRDAVASYVGAVQWVMLAHDRSPLPGTNWIVEPQLVEKLRDEASSLGVPVWKVCEQRMPAFGPMAYEDLLGLVAHVKAIW